MKKLFMRKRPMELFLEFERTDILSRAARRVDATQAHSAKLLDEFVRLDLIKKEKFGRINLLTYTKKGEILKDIFLQLKNLE